MPDLIPIGRFSQLTGLTIKALRLYDARGLLHPAVVDFRSGFRYYRLDQAETAERIRLLRSLEMPLEDIRVLLATHDPEAVRGRLAAHRRWIETRIDGYGEALKLLGTLGDRWRGIDKGSVMHQEGKASSYRCSFCGKGNAEVERMIAGPNGVFICDECVQKCNEIIAKEREWGQGSAS